MSIDYEKIKRLISLVEENGLTELGVEEEGLSITIKAELPTDVISALARVEVRPKEVSQPVMQSQAPEEKIEGELVHIISPMVGVFYRQSSPDAPPYIDVGDEIEVGQTLGLIEAMKVFSEVPSEVAGRVVAIPAETGKLVQQGDILVTVDISAQGGG